MSGIDLDDKLVETASRVSTTINEYGDVDYGSTSSEACLYRDISMRTQAQNRDGVIIDGLLWFGGSSPVARGDVYYHSSEGYLRIEKVTKAKRLVADDSLQFIKCEVTKQRQIS